MNGSDRRPDPRRASTTVTSPRGFSTFSTEAVAPCRHFSCGRSKGQHGRVAEALAQIRDVREHRVATLAHASEQIRVQERPERVARELCPERREVEPLQRVDRALAKAL